MYVWIPKQKTTFSLSPCLPCIILEIHLKISFFIHENTSIDLHIFLEDIINISLFFFLFFLLPANDPAAAEGDTLERLRNISKMFNTKDNDEPQQLKKMEKVAPADKIKNTFQK